MAEVAAVAAAAAVEFTKEATRDEHALSLPARP